MAFRRCKKYASSWNDHEELCAGNVSSDAATDAVSEDRRCIELHRH